MVLSDYMSNVINISCTFELCQRTGPFWSAFRKKGYLLEETSVDGKAMIRMISPEGHVWVTSTNISYPMVSHLVNEIASNKFWAYGIVKSSGLRIPETELLSDQQTVADSRLLSIASPVIVKPLDSFGSKGVSLNITDDWHLADAIAAAKKISSAVIVQEQVEGEEIRFTIIKSKVASVLLRQSPRVTGDGRSTVAQLIEKENIERSKLDFEYITYPQLTETHIGNQYLKSQEVLADGEVLELSSATMIKRGASVYDIVDEVDESYIKIAEKIAYALGASFITVDIFVKNYSQPANDHNYWFNECNTAPALRLYYGDKNKKGPSTAVAIIEQMDHMIRTGL